MPDPQNYDTKRCIEARWGCHGKWGLTLCDWASGMGSLCPIPFWCCSSSSTNWRWHRWSRGQDILATQTQQCPGWGSTAVYPCQWLGGGDNRDWVWLHGGKHLVWQHGAFSFIIISTRKRKERESIPVIAAPKIERSSTKTPSPGHNQNVTMPAMTVTLIPAVSQMVRVHWGEWKIGNCQRLHAMAQES